MKSTRLMIVLCASLAVCALWPADAAAQRRGGYRPPVRVVVSAGYYRPYYYDPFFYSGFYDPFYMGWYPLYAQYPYPRGRYYGYSGNWASARLEWPRDAQVYLDGYLVGMVDQFDGVFQRLDLPTGEHEIEVYMRGYRPYRQRTLFRPGETYHFKAILEPLPAGAPEEPPPQPSANRPDPPEQPERTRTTPRTSRSVAGTRWDRIRTASRPRRRSPAIAAVSAAGRCRCRCRCRPSVPAIAAPPTATPSAR